METVDLHEFSSCLVVCLAKESHEDIFYNLSSSLYFSVHVCCCNTLICWFCSLFSFTTMSFHAWRTALKNYTSHRAVLPFVLLLLCHRSYHTCLWFVYFHILFCQHSSSLISMLSIIYHSYILHIRNVAVTLSAAILCLCTSNSYYTFQFSLVSFACCGYHGSCAITNTLQNGTVICHKFDAQSHCLQLPCTYVHLYFGCPSHSSFFGFVASDV